MSAGQQALLMGGNGQRIGFDITSLADNRVGTSANAGASFSTAGVLTITGNLSNGSQVTAWASPGGAGIGSSYWIKLTVVGAGPLGGDLQNTVLALSSARSWTWVQNTTGSQSGTGTITIYRDAAGTQVVASDTFNVSLTRS